MRRLSLLIGLICAGLMVGVLPAAAAPGPFGPEQIVVNCIPSQAEASIAPDGTTRGFVACTGGSAEGPIYYFHAGLGASIVRENTPWTGQVLSTAWDGVNSEYVLFAQDRNLWIAKRFSSNGAYSAATLLDNGAFYDGADLVAANGQWWAVWSKPVAASGLGQHQLYQTHTLLGNQGRVRVTNTAANIWDREPTLGYHTGTVTMIWTRTTNPTGSPSCVLRVATNHGTAWSTTTLSDGGTCNQTADSIDYNGVSYATWNRDGRIEVANNVTGRYVSHLFGTPGRFPKIGVSGGKVFLGWMIEQAGVDKFLFTQGTGPAWTSVVLSGFPGFPQAVLGQGGKARVLYNEDERLVYRAQS